MKNIKKLVLISLVSACIGLAFPYVNFAIDQTYQQLKVIVDVMELIKENYVDEIDSQKLIYGAAAGMVRELDDFSQFMEPDVYTRVKSDTEGEFGGIGIRVDLREGWLTVVTPLPNTPAYRAQMYPGNKIIKIEGESTKDMIIDDAIKKLRGVPGTKVNITIAREPEDKGADWINKDITLIRELIKTENIKSRVIDGKIGYIKMIEFTGHVVEDFTRALEDLKGSYRYIFIDCPPSLGLLTLNALVASDSVLVPVQCEYYALEGLSMLTKTIRRIQGSFNPRLDIKGIVLTMFDTRNNLAHQVVEEVRKHFGEKVYQTMIPRNIALGEAPSHGKPAMLYDMKSRGAQSYLALAKEILSEDSAG